jgi:malate dehydrogenase (oxaloacetate-decarboxylating)
VRIAATGRSDYPNQINNVLCFPGIFRGALDVRSTAITEDMKMAAAQPIAAIVEERELREHYIIPSGFNRDVAPRRGRRRGRPGGRPAPRWPARRWASRTVTP